MRAMKYLPQGVAEAINGAVDMRSVSLSEISEIRLRRGLRASLSLDRVNMRLPYACTEADMRLVMDKLCRGSAYAYERQLNDGYIAAEGGMRVAVNTAVRYSDGRLRREYTPTSVVFRIPVHTEGQTRALAEIMKASAGGMLIFSPPAVGKTTVLRDLVITLSGAEHSMRISVIDCRGEIDDGLFPEACLADIISGCDRGEGMEWALRTLSPQIIAVDELSPSDTDAVISAARRGVPVIATVHARGFDEVLSRADIYDAFECGAFEHLVRLERMRGACPTFEVRSFEGGGWKQC